MRDLVIRSARTGDEAILVALIRAHAAFDGRLERCRVTEDGIRRFGFGPQPSFEALLAELRGQPVGFILFYPMFSTWEGRAGMFVDDFFVVEAVRGNGIGRRLLAEVSALAMARGYARVDWQVLKDARARGFYEALGARWVEDFLVYRLQGDALESLAQLCEQRWQIQHSGP